MKRTNPVLALLGIAFHGGMMFLLPLIVGFVASLVLEVSEVAETAIGLAIGAALVVGPVFVALIGGVTFKVMQEARFFMDKGALDLVTLLDVIHRHLAIVTPSGYGVLISGVIFVLLSLGFQWASLGVLAVLSLVMFYWVVGASVFLSAFMVRTFSWGMGRSQAGIRREMSPAVVATGFAVEERFHLTRVPIFPGYRLLVHDQLPERLETESRYIANPSAAREMVTLSGLLRRTPRGRYRVGPARIQYQDALGLTRVAVASLATAELTVLPRVRPVRIVEPPRSLDEEPDILTVRHRFATEDFYKFRNYVPGDDLRFVDWNTYARLEKLFLKMFLEEEDLHFYALIDASASMDFGEPTKLQYARQLAAALGFVGLIRGDRVKVETLGHGNHGASPVFRGRRSLWRMLDHVEGLEPESSISLTEGVKKFCLRNSGKGIVVLLTDLMDKSGYEAALKYLVSQDMDIYVIQVLSAEELDPDVQGDLQLIDCEDGDVAEITVTAQMMKRYKQTLAAMVDSARDFCTRRGMVYLLARNEVPVEDLMTGYLRTRGLVR